MVTLVQWDKYGYVVASKYRKKVVIALTEKPRTPKEISNETRLYLSHVSSTLSSLVEKGIVQCLTPSLRRGKIFDLTDDGRSSAGMVVSDFSRLAWRLVETRANAKPNSKH